MGLWWRDSLINFVTSLGTLKDPSTHSRYVLNVLTLSDLNNAYRGDWLAKKVVVAPAQDATREWRKWQAEREQITAIEASEKALDLQRKLKNAMILARLYGGAGMILGVAKGRSDEELDLDAVAAGDLKFVHVMSKNDLVAGPIEDNVTSPWFGKPSYYTISSSPVSPKDQGVEMTTKIHPSRVVRLLGSELMDRSMSSDNWMGESVLQVVDDAVRATGTVTGGIAAMIHDSKMDVVKIPGFTKHVDDDGYTGKLFQRFTVANQSKSVVNTLVLDKDEEWDRVQTNFGSLPDIMRMYLMLASGASDIPMSRLLGQSNSGLGGSGSGENDTRNYYDRIASEQTTTLSPALTQLDEVLVRSALGRADENVYYEWAPLWKLDEKEEAELASKKAATFKVDVDTALINEDVLREVRVNQLVEDGVYPGLEAAVEEYGAEPEEPEPVTPTEAIPPEKPFVVADARPRTLYVRRDVLNSDDIVRWAEDQGFTATLPADEMHVTIAFSRTQIDWMKVESTWGGDEDGKFTVKPGGARLVEKLGDAVVLLFNASELSWRHETIKRAGASWDWPEYQPHVTITYDPPVNLDLESIEPYRGEIKLGPEIFEEVDEDWAKKLRGKISADAHVVRATVKRPKKKK